MLRTPMVVVYKVGRLTFWIGRALVRLRTISLVNLVLGRTVVPEVLQSAATAEGIASVAEELLSDPRRLQDMSDELAELRAQLGDGGASARAAAIVKSVLLDERG